MFEINYQQEIEKISKWIKKTVESAGFSKIVIAVSGGIDSAVSSALCVKAIGPKNVFCVLLPYGKLSDEHTKDAKDILKTLQIPQENIFETDIKPAVDIILRFSLDNEGFYSTNSHSRLDRESIQIDSRFRGNDKSIKNIRKGNIMARVRMIYVFDTAKKLNAIVCGTENKTEHYLGYFTRFGDEASDLEPIKKFYKTQIWEFGKVLNVPAEIISKAPTAGLWESQTDEGELGFTYKEADQVLYYHFDENLSEDQIAEKGIPQETIKKVLNYVTKNDFKHLLPHEFK